jgi:hypothetical protein
MPVTFLLSAAADDAAWVALVTGVLDDLRCRWERVESSHGLVLNPVLDAVGADEPAILVTVLSPAFFAAPGTRDLWPVADAMAGRGRLRLLPVLVTHTSLPPPLRDY